MIAAITPEQLQNYGALTVVLAQFREALGDGGAAGEHLMSHFKQNLIVIEVALIFIGAMFRSEAPGATLHRFVGLLVWMTVVAQFNMLTEVFVRSMGVAGLTVGGLGGGGMKLLEDPSRMLGLGADLTEPLLTYAQDLGFADVATKLLYYFAYLAMMVCYVFLAVNLLYANLEYYLYGALALVLAPFAISKHLRFVAEKGINIVVNSGIKLMVMGCLLALSNPIISVLKFSSFKGDLPWKEFWALLGVVVFLVVFMLRAPAKATAMMSGTPTGNATGLMLAMGAATLAISSGVLGAFGAFVGRFSEAGGKALGKLSGGVNAAGQAALQATAAAANSAPPPRYGGGGGRRSRGGGRPASASPSSGGGGDPKGEGEAAGGKS